MFTLNMHLYIHKFTSYKFLSLLLAVESPFAIPIGTKNKSSNERKSQMREMKKTFEPMYYETNCTCVCIEEWNQLMKGARKCSYKRLVSKIKREIPELYFDLCLNIYNPFEGQCKQTKNHYILVHSAIEYLIRK